MYILFIKTSVRTETRDPERMYLSNAKDKD